jgi:hypothetical protein
MALGLPRGCLELLISAHVAALIPPSRDIDFFAKRTLKEKLKKRRRASKPAQVSDYFFLCKEILCVQFGLMVSTKKTKQQNTNIARPLTLQRLLAVYTALFDRPIESDAQLLAQVCTTETQHKFLNFFFHFLIPQFLCLRKMEQLRSLTDMGFLQSSGADIGLDTIKLFSHITPTVASAVASTIGFDLSKYAAEN